MMETTMRALALGIGLGTVTVSTRAQEGPEPARLVWTGSEEAVELSPDDVERAIRALEAEVALTRDFADVDQRLAEVWKRATYGDHPERIDAILETMEARSEFLHDSDLDRAIDVASRLWIDEQDLARYGWSRADFRPATAAEREAESRSLEDGKLGVYFRTFREEQHAALLGGDEGPADERSRDPLVQRIRNALSVGDGELIRELGPVAVDPLKQLTVASIDEFLMSTEADPLTHLFELADAEALELCRAHVDDGGYFWRRRILRVLAGRGLAVVALIEHSRAALLRILEACLSDRDLVGDVVDLLRVRAVAHRGLVTPTMSERLLAAVADNSPDMREHLNRLLGRYEGAACVESLVDALLLSPHRELAELGAHYARTYADVNPLRTLVEHESPVVRGALAESLRPRRYRDSREIEPSLEAGDAERLARLAVDPDASVRLEVAKTIVASPLRDELGRDALLALARDESVDVRRELARVQLADVELLRDVLVALAERPEIGVENLLLGRLGQRTWGSLTPAYFETLTTVVAARDDWRERDPHHALKPFRRALRPALTSALAETIAWVATSRDDWLTANVLDALVEDPQLFWLHEAAPADLAYVLAQAPRLAPQPAARWIGKTEEWLSGFHLPTLERLFRDLREADSERGSRRRPLPVEALERLAAMDLPPEVRTGALGALHSHWHDELTPLLLESLHSTEWREPSDVTYLTRLAFDAAESNETALAVTAAPQIPDGIAHPLVASFARGNAISIELARAILARWLEDDTRRVAVADALRAFGRHPDADDGGLLEREALGSRYPAAAIAALDRRRDPAAFPTLARCLRAKWIADAELRDEVRRAAAAALTGSLRDDAARILLGELERTDDDAFRGVLLSSLQTIRTYQDEQATWRRRLAEKELRADAIRELVAMLDDETDPEIRAEAARALGTLGAIEALPRLIRLLRDEDVELRTAARDALDRLNRPKRSTEPGPAESDDDSTER